MARRLDVYVDGGFVGSISPGLSQIFYITRKPNSIVNVKARLFNDNSDMGFVNIGGSSNNTNYLTTVYDSGQINVLNKTGWREAHVKFNYSDSQSFGFWVHIYEGIVEPAQNSDIRISIDGVIAGRLLYVQAGRRYRYKAEYRHNPDSAWEPIDGATFRDKTVWSANSLSNNLPDHFITFFAKDGERIGITPGSRSVDEGFIEFDPAATGSNHFVRWSCRKTYTNAVEDTEYIQFSFDSPPPPPDQVGNVRLTYPIPDRPLMWRDAPIVFNTLGPFLTGTPIRVTISHNNNMTSPTVSSTFTKDTMNDLPFLASLINDKLILLLSKDTVLKSWAGQGTVYIEVRMGTSVNKFLINFPAYPYDIATTTVFDGEPWVIDDAWHNNACDMIEMINRSYGKTVTLARRNAGVDKVFANHLTTLRSRLESIAKDPMTEIGYPMGITPDTLWKREVSKGTLKHPLDWKELISYCQSFIKISETIIPPPPAPVITQHQRTADTVTLTWTGDTEDYIVKQGDVEVWRGKAKTFTIPNLIPNTSYTFLVHANNGRVSSLPATITVQTSSRVPGLAVVRKV